jgi:hypothetical protein
MAPGGDFEGGLLGGLLSGWKLLGAGAVSGNEPWKIGGSGDSKALRLVGTDSASSPSMCIDRTFPNFRFFARNAGNPGATLTVDVVYQDTHLRTVTKRAGVLRAGGSGWFVADPMAIDVTFGGDDAAAPVQFKLTSSSGGDWRIDDFYVDPWARR